MEAYWKPAQTTEDWFGVLPMHSSHNDRLLCCVLVLFLSRLIALSCREPIAAGRTHRNGATGAAPKSFAERREIAAFSLNLDLKGDNSRLQPASGLHGETQDIIVPPGHVSAKQVGITFSHE